MAVYTHLSDPQIAALIEGDYAIGRFLRAEGISQGVSNTNYRVDVEVNGGVQPYILTLYEARTETSELPFFLGLMEHLAKHGIACPKPIPRCDGEVISRIAGKYAALISFLPGKSRIEMDETHCAAVGHLLAALHKAGSAFEGKRANTLSLSGWWGLHTHVKGKLDAIEPGFDRLVAEELSYLDRHWPRDLPQGAIHADLFPDNVFFEDDAVSGVIDFYFACTDAWAYDLAVTLNAWCFEQHTFNVAKAQALFAAYESQQQITMEEKNALPILLRGAAMRFLLTRAYDWLLQKTEAVVTPHDPREYAAKLRYHQQQNGQYPWRQ